MRHIIFCISGFSGVGKDEFCRALKERHGAVQIGMADAAKRHMADLYGFTEHQLFGPSKARNAGDVRYPKRFPIDTPVVWLPEAPEAVRWSETPVHKVKVNVEGEEKILFMGDPEYWLSPRETLQKYCEHMNKMYLDTWIRKGLSQHLDYAKGGVRYTPMQGLVRDGSESVGDPKDLTITCFADFRHIHEFKAAARVRSAATEVYFIRIVSDRVPTPPYDHRSETEQTQIPDSDFHFIVKNNDTIERLHDAASVIVQHLRDVGPLISKNDQ